MDISKRETDVNKEIRCFLLNYLQSSRWDSEIKDLISSLLHREGKIFCAQSHFTWGEFCYYVSSIFCNHSAYQEKEKQIAYSGAVEFLILATDLIDDLADNDFKKDSELTMPQMLTISNMLLMEAFYMFLKYSTADSSDEYSSVIRNLRTAALGQWRDLSFTVSKQIPSEDDYFALIGQKSVSLITLIFELNGTEKKTKWEDIVKYIGYSAQLKNDASDILLDSKSDLVHKKATLPLIKAVEFSVKKDRGWLLTQIRQLDDYGDKKNRLQKIREYIKKTGAIDYCLILSKIYHSKAIQLLRGYGPLDEKHTQELLYYLGDGI